MKQHRGYRFLPKVRVDDKMRDYVVNTAGLRGETISQYIKKLIKREMEEKHEKH